MDLTLAIKRLAEDPSAPLDLAEVAFALARDEYPDLDTEAYLNELNGMAHEAASLLRGDLETRVRGLCRYLFHDMGFRGNDKDYYDSRNSYLNEVLDRRTGIPITLSAVAMAVAGRAGLPVFGVGLPGHFVAKAVEDGHEILFDPFHGGRLLQPQECEILVEQMAGLSFHANEQTLQAVPLGQIVQRMLTNLKGVYLSGGDFDRAIRVIGRLCQLAPGDMVQRRDLGAALVRAGQPGSAIAHLEAYLSAPPKRSDDDAVRKVLEQARGEVARWN